jgi:Translation initiation factor SUI1
VVEVVKKGSIKKVVLALEDRQGGRKHITRITHVESFAIDPTELANVMQRKFQTSSSVTVKALKRFHSTPNGKDPNWAMALLMKFFSAECSRVGEMMVQRDRRPLLAVVCPNCC